MSLHRNADQPVSIIGSHKTKSAIEITANIIFIVCAFVAIVAVLAITIYMIYSGAPALFKVGILDILFGTTWAPTAEDPSFGILYIILTSIIGTTLAILIGVPIALMTAIFLSEVANSKLANIVRPAVELLAGIPSVIYGLLGVLMINPAIYKLEQAIFKDDPNHQFTGGANLLSAVLVLAIMILPTASSAAAVPQFLFSVRGQQDPDDL